MNNVTNILDQNPNVQEPDRVVLLEILPFIDEMSEDLGLSLDHMTFIMLVRRMASAGASIDELVDDLVNHYNHQIEWKARR